jgi:hypothetical protein
MKIKYKKQKVKKGRGVAYCMPWIKYVLNKPGHGNC